MKTFAEFISIANKLAVEKFNIFDLSYNYHCNDKGALILKVQSKQPKKGRKNINCYFERDFDSIEHDSPHFYIKWETGGASGGDCWEGKAEEYSCNATEPEFVILDSFLSLVSPSLSFLQYKEILQLIKKDELTDYEYYGNRTEYNYKWIDLKDLYEFLKERNIL